MSYDKEREDFEAVFDRIVSALIPENPSEDFWNTNRWIRRMINYNVPKGKYFRGMAVICTVKLLAEHQNRTLNDEELELARVLGWALEFLQTSFLIFDDIIDQSMTRRGRLCWHRLDDVGLVSCNDALLLQHETYHILELYFADKDYSHKLIKLILEISRLTGYGQCMDLTSNLANKGPQFDLYTQTRYETIIKYKTSYYSFVLPVRLAMYMCSITSETEHKNAEEILLKIGHLFQIQDDNLDCWADHNIIGKIGTDIVDGKCTWNIVTALGLCDEFQTQILIENYGKTDKECVRRVKDIYNAINLKDVYHLEEEKYHKIICQMIDNLKTNSQLNPQIFKRILDQIYRRQK